MRPQPHHRHQHQHQHREGHRSGATGWLRAAVLGSNDAIISTSGLMIGVASSEASPTSTLVAGIAALVAGAMSMAVGEFVSVSSQRDAELADLAREKRELAATPEAELDELAGIYVARGLEPALAMQVAKQLSEHDVLAAHARDELGITEGSRAQPLQASIVSAISFAVFALLPILALLAANLFTTTSTLRIVTIASVSLVSLAGLGALGGRLGGAALAPAAMRVTLGGGLAMAITYAIGRLVGTAVG